MKRMVILLLALAMIVTSSLAVSANVPGGSEIGIYAGNAAGSAETAPLRSVTETPGKESDPNVPLYLGALTSVGLFAGVAVFCKLRGRKK